MPEAFFVNKVTHEGGREEGERRGGMEELVNVVVSFFGFHPQVKLLTQ